MIVGPRPASIFQREGRTLSAMLLLGDSMTCVFDLQCKKGEWLAVHIVLGTRC